MYSVTSIHSPLPGLRVKTQNVETLLNHPRAKYHTGSQSQDNQEALKYWKAEI